MKKEKKPSDFPDVSLDPDNDQKTVSLHLLCLIFFSSVCQRKQLATEKQKLPKNFCELMNH